MAASSISSMEHPNGQAFATIAFDRSGVAVVQFRPKVMLCRAVISTVMQLPVENSTRACATIVVIPEDTECDMDLIAVDHYADHGLAHRTEAVAFVCHELGLVPMLRLYFAHHPVPFPVTFCTTVEEARTWMRAREGRGLVA